MGIGHSLLRFQKKLPILQLPKNRCVFWCVSLFPTFGSDRFHKRFLDIGYWFESGGTD